MKLPKPIHPFAARMAPALVLQELEGRAASRVLDPMAGSGTTLAVAKACGHHAIGFDLDPLAVLIARGWVTDAAGTRLHSTAARVLQTARRLARQVSARDAFPTKDKETQAFIRYWFDRENRRQLWALATAIKRSRVDEKIRTLLWCGFSRMIIAKTASVSLAADIPHSRPHRVYQRSPYKAFERFIPCVAGIAERLPSHRLTGTAAVERGDARGLAIADASIDFVITSPPYLNAIDYMRTSRFSLVWMGHRLAELRALRASSVGTEVGFRESDKEVDATVTLMARGAALPGPECAMLRRYVVDMNRVVREIGRVLVPGGTAMLVIGDSAIRGVYIENSRCIESLATRSGMLVVCRSERELPPNLRYLPPPRKERTGFGSRMRTEVVLQVVKT